VVAEDRRGTSAESQQERLGLLLLGVCAEQRREIERLSSKNVELAETNQVLAGEIECLKRRLGLDSKNSSKPPSSDGLKRKRRTARSPERERRKRQGRRPGKQKGAAGRYLLPAENPDQEVELLPSFCGKCERRLENGIEESVEKRQVWDLPEPRKGLEKVEYQAYGIRCPECGEITRAKFPRWAKAPVSLGPRVHGMTSYLTVQQYLPFERTQDYFREVHGVEVSEGALVKMVRRGGEAVEEAREKIKRQLQQAEVVNFDETGAHLKGELRWVHGASTEKLTLLGLPCRRGKEGLEELGVGAKFSGIAIHDSLSAYWGEALGRIRGHGLCNAHHLRELAAVSDLDRQRWSGRMTNLLLEMLTARNAAMDAGKWKLEPELTAEFERRYERVIKEGWRENPRRKGKRQGSKAGNLLWRLDEHRAGVLRFIHDFKVPFTNNQIERDLRMTKLHEKISGGWRSEEGAKAFLAVRSYLSTARKQGQGMLEVMSQAFEGRPWLPAAGP
jgi:transposase